jgi:hypothetical protein
MATPATHNSAGSLDAVYTIPARLARLEMNQQFFAELNSINKVEFSRLMSGQKPMGAAQTLKFDAMLTALESLVKMWEPIPLAWRDVEVVRNLMEGSDVLPDAEKQNIRQSLDLIQGFAAGIGKE